MKKRILALLLAVCMVVLVLPALALPAAAAATATRGTVLARLYHKYGDTTQDVNMPTFETVDGVSYAKFGDFAFVGHHVNDWKASYLLSKATIGGSAFADFENLSTDKTGYEIWLTHEKLKQSDSWTGYASANLHHTLKNGAFAMCESTNWGPLYGLIAYKFNYAGYQYTVAADGYYSLSVDSLTFSNQGTDATNGFCTTAKFSIAIDGKVIWPQGAVYGDVSGWQAVADYATKEGSQTLVPLDADHPLISYYEGADLPHDVTFYAPAGAKVEFLVGIPQDGSIYRNRGTAANLTVSSLGDRVVFRNLESGGTSVGAGWVTMPELPDGYIGWDTDRDGIADAKPGDVRYLSGVVCVPVKTFAAGEASKISANWPEVKETEVLWGGGWQTGNYYDVAVGNHPAGSFIPYTQPGSEISVISGSSSAWSGDGSGGGIYLNYQRHTDGDATVNSYKLVVRKTHSTAMAYTAPMDGKVTLSLDKLFSKRETASSTPAALIALEFAIYKNGEKIFPTEDAKTYRGEEGSVTLVDGWYRYVSTNTHSQATTLNVLAVMNDFSLPDVSVTAGDTLYFAVRMPRGDENSALQQSWMAYMEPVVTWQEASLATEKGATVTFRDYAPIKTDDFRSLDACAGGVAFRDGWQLSARSKSNFGDTYLLDRLFGTPGANSDQRWLGNSSDYTGSTFWSNTVAIAHYGNGNSATTHDWGGTWAVSPCGTHYAGWEYVAQASGTVNLGCEWLTQKHGPGYFAIFVNGTMVWPAKGDYYQDTSKWWQFAAPSGTFVSHSAEKLQAKVSFPQNVEVKAGDVVSFLVGGDRTSAWGTNAAPYVTYTSVGTAHAVVNAASVGITGNFAVNLFVAADESATEAGVVVDGKTYAGAKQSDGRYKVTLPGIAAKDMDTEILYQPYEVVGGKQVLNFLRRTRLTTLFSAYAEIDSTKEIANTALAYHKWASYYFGKTTASPAAVADVTMPLAVDYEAKLSGVTEGAGMNFYGATLLLQDKINIKLFLKTKDGADISKETLQTYRMKITKTDGTVVKELGNESIAYETGSRDTVVVTATALPATYYGEMLCFTLTDGEGNAVSPTLHYGVMTYVARQYNEAGGDEKLNGILRAIVAYCNAVTAYHD